MKTQIVAHRGAGGWDRQYAPENTMTAFQRAIEMGADAIETDVQMTKDGILVLCHDETIDRTSDGTGWIKNHTLAELRRYDFSSVHPEAGFTPIPALEELLAYMRAESFWLNIELKTGLVYYDRLEEKTADMVHAYGMEDRVLYSSFNYYSLEKLRAYDASARIAILCTGDYVTEEDAVRLGAEAVHPDFTHLTTGYVRRWHEAGIKVDTWTCDNAGKMAFLLAMGVDAIITDCPDTGRRVVDGSEASA